MNFNEAYSSLDRLYESKRVISDADILYHYTNPTPFVKIIKENCLRADINTEAVCLTTDKDYVIYQYPCGFQFSRQNLLDAGYELELFDDTPDEPDRVGESEERILGNIDNVLDYITAVYINWQTEYLDDYLVKDFAEIPIVYDSTSDTYRIADARYDQHKDEYEDYSLTLTGFRLLLSSLKARGIQVIERGRPQFGKYYLDDSGKLCSGTPPIEKIG